MDNKRKHQREAGIIRSQMENKLFIRLTNTECVLAGGAITSIFSDRPINDFDIYSRDKKDLDAVVGFFENTDAELEMETDFARTYKFAGNIYQVIHMEDLMGDADSIFDSFDFTVCMGSYKFKTDEFYFDDNFFKHLAQKRIVFNNRTPFPIASLVRTKKYMSRGFTMSNVETFKLALAINKLDLSNYKTLRHQLMGMDASILKPMLDSLAACEDADQEMFLEKVNEYLGNAGWEISAEN